MSNPVSDITDDWWDQPSVMPGTTRRDYLASRAQTAKPWYVKYVDQSDMGYLGASGWYWWPRREGEGWGPFLTAAEADAHARSVGV